MCNIWFATDQNKHLSICVAPLVLQFLSHRPKQTKIEQIFGPLEFPLADKWHQPAKTPEWSHLVISRRRAQAIWDNMEMGECKPHYPCSQEQHLEHTPIARRLCATAKRSHPQFRISPTRGRADQILSATFNGDLATSWRPPKIFLLEIFSHKYP